MNYLKADLYRIGRERKFLLSLAILLLITLLFAFVMKTSHSQGETDSLLQVIAQLLPLFFLAPSNVLIGEDFQHRTLNNLIAKTQNRRPIFIYKILANLFFCFLYIIIAYLSVGIFRILFSGAEAVDWGIMASTFLYQLPLYSCVILLLSLIFILMKKTSQAYLTYILLVLLFDNIVSVIFHNLLGIEPPQSLFIFSAIQSLPTNWDGASMVGLLFTFIYLASSYYLFQHKELK